MTAETYSYFGVGGAILALLVPISQLLFNSHEKGFKRITHLGLWMILVSIYIGVISFLTIHASSVEQMQSQKILQDSIIIESKIQDSIIRIEIIDSIKVAFARFNSNASITYNSTTNSFVINNNSNNIVTRSPLLQQRHFTNEDLRKMLKNIPKTVYHISIETIGDERESFIYANEMKDKLTLSGYKNITMGTLPLTMNSQNIYNKFTQWPTNIGQNKDTIQWGILIYPH